MQVFISHHTPDAALAHKLASHLEQAGATISIAPDSIRPGESWVEAIDRGLSTQDGKAASMPRKPINANVRIGKGSDGKRSA